jgi:two-component system, NarL family, invasion response regulator UvrY
VNPVRVLVVDDQEVFRRVMGAVVEQTEGFVLVGHAESGEESVVTAGALRPDLVLMDVNLPGIDGREATQAARGSGDGRRGAVVDIRRGRQGWQAQECGAVTYVAKSAFGPDTLRAVWAMTGG